MIVIKKWLRLLNFEKLLKNQCILIYLKILTLYKNK